MQKMKLFEGDNAKFLPDQTFESKATLIPDQGPDRVELYHFGAGHTNGDTSSCFRRFASLTPAISSRGQRRLASTSAMAAAASPIPRRCECSRKPFRASTRSFPATRRRQRPGTRSWNSASSTRRSWPRSGRPFDAGKTVDEAVAGLTLPEKFKDYGMQNAKDNVAKIYAELKSK